AIDATVAVVLRRSEATTCMRQLARYCIGGWPIILAKSSGTARAQKPPPLPSPVGQILHRRLADHFGETLVQGRARKSHAPAELVDRPIGARSIVHEGKRAADETVAQPGEPAATVLRQHVDIAAHGVDEHHLAHALEHPFSA